MPIQDNQNQQNTSQPPEPAAKPRSTADVLSGLAQGQFGGMEKVIRFVKDGRKLDNAAMVELLLKLKREHGFTCAQLLDTYLTLDKAVEDGVLDNDLIEYMKGKSSIIN